MRIAFFGDVVGKPGRAVVETHLPRLREKLSLDFIVVNAENSAGGFGLTEAIARDFFDAGADCLTLGDHAWDQREMLSFIDREPRLIRPLNYSPHAQAPGKGSNVFALPDGRMAGVIQLQGNVFMKQTLDNPFLIVDEALADMRLREICDVIIVDMHCEATSEKMAMGHHCDGRVSLVVGTHTHIPTADAQVLTGGTAYLTDAGMCGDYDSVIGMRKENSLYRFRTQMPGERYQPALSEGTLCGVFVETDDKTGLAKRIDPIRVGGRLQAFIPAI